MAITSLGYAGQITAANLPTYSWNLVAGYTVATSADLKVTATTGDRTVAIANGVAVGAGVVDACVDIADIALPSVSSGSRWDLIAVRRNWSTGTTTVVRVEGTSARAIPSGRESTVGTLDDQPLALVRVAAGSTVIQEIVDLRTGAFDGGVVAQDILALSFVNRIGAEVRIGDLVYQRVIDALGVESWAALNVASQGPVTPTFGPGWSQDSAYPVTIRRDGAWAEIEGALRAGPTAVFTSMVGIPIGYRPARNSFLSAHRSSAGNVYDLVALSSNGALYADLQYNSASTPVSGALYPVSGRWRVA